MTVATKPLAVFGDPVDEASLLQIQNVLDQPQAVKGALMADHHKGYSMPIGGVVAFEEAISPNGVGFDIACGNACARTNIRLADLLVSVVGQANAETSTEEPEIIHAGVKPFMREIQRKVSFGMGRKNETPFDHEVLDRGQNIWLDVINEFGVGLYDKAAQQLGTVGSGNHYVDLLVDEHGYVWVANHFGSRGLGHTIASGFLAAAEGLAFTERVKESDDPVVFSTNSDLGQFYIEAMKLAGRYAYAGRDYVLNQVLEILGAKPTFYVHNHHNFAWQEGPDKLWVVRKGATPLTEDYAFIGGSMGDDSYIVRGKMPDPQEGHEQMLDSLYGRVVDLGNLGSAPHGAGRQMSRTKAAGKMRKMWVCPNRNCDFEPIPSTGNKTGFPSNHCPQCGIPLRRERMRDASTAAIDWDATRASLTERGIVVLGAGADEAPGAYKRLDEVLAHHPNIEIAHRLSPIGVVMAGPDTFDPYKD